MVEEYNQNYEVSSEGCVRHWEIPYASLEDATPTVSNPAQVLGTDSLQLTGTILVVDANTSVAIIDFTPSMVYRQPVRNSLTNNGGGVDQTWGPINIGDRIYYDNSAALAAVGIYLSTSPLNGLGQANTLFGWAVPMSATDTFPKGAALVASTPDVGVMQHGA